MSVNLSKGQKVSLTKDNPGLTNVVVGLGWDVNQYDTGGAFDLDASAFMLQGSGRVGKDSDFVFYGNSKDNSGAVQHMGDNRTGDGNGDDEQIKVNLAAVPNDVEKIAFSATIYDENNKGFNFGMVNNAYIRIFDEATGAELARYDLCEDFSIETSVVFGELYRNNGEWKFNAIGSGYQGGLKALCSNYGVNV